jgi:hypothetical protein
MKEKILIVWRILPFVELARLAEKTYCNEIVIFMAL